jgi:transcriptional regulator with XRE-family HTH domain
MSQKKLASLTGIPPDTLRRIEDGTLRRLTPDKAKRIAITTGVDAKKLLNGQVVPSKKTNRDWTPRLGSAVSVFAALVDEVLECESYLKAQNAFDSATEVLKDKTATKETKRLAQVAQDKAKVAMEEANRRRELFHYLFSKWAAEIVGQFELKRRLLDRISAMRNQGTIFIVPESLLPEDKDERLRWYQEGAKALLITDQDGKPVLSSAFTKQWEEMRALEAEEYKKAHRHDALQLSGLESRKKTVRLSRSDETKLRKLLVKRAQFLQERFGG